MKEQLTRPYRTEYYASETAAGKRPVAQGYAVTLKGARRSVAMRIILGEYAFGAVIHRTTGNVVCYQRRNQTGLTLKDTPLENGEQPPPPDSMTKVDELREKMQHEYNERWAALFPDIAPPKFDGPKGNGSKKR
jgi:hypothetical protein